MRDKNRLLEPREIALAYIRGHGPATTVELLTSQHWATRSGS